MNAILMKRLFQSSSRDQCRHGYTVPSHRRRGEKAWARPRGQGVGADSNCEANAQVHDPNQGTLQRLPTSRRDSAPLVREIPVEKLRHHMVLPDAVERRFHRTRKGIGSPNAPGQTRLEAPASHSALRPGRCGRGLAQNILPWNTGLPLRKVRFDTFISSFSAKRWRTCAKCLMPPRPPPAPLFLDECDTLARSRMERNDVGEVTRITNALL